MNKAILIGRLTADPELRYTQSGKAVCGFTLAVDRVGKDGEREADFINCTVWNKAAESLAQYMRKGYRIGIDGSIRVESYEKDGQRRWATKVLCQHIEFLESKHDNRTAAPAQNNVVTDAYGNAFGTEVSFSDEDLPF